LEAPWNPGLFSNLCHMEFMQLTGLTGDEMKAYLLCQGSNCSMAGPRSSLAGTQRLSRIRASQPRGTLLKKRPPDDGLRSSDSVWRDLPATRQSLMKLYSQGQRNNVVTYNTSPRHRKRALEGAHAENQVVARPTRTATPATSVQPARCHETSPEKWVSDAMHPFPRRNPATPSVSSKRRRRPSRLPPEYPLPQPGPRPTSEDFYAFVSERERIRRKREARERWPWTQDEVLQKFRFTNVKRSDDRTTKVVERLLRTQDEAWVRGADGFEDKKARARSHLLNIAVWRRFGSADFIERVGWRRAPSNESELKVWEEQTVNVANSLWREKVAACTDAYFPARCCHNAEVSAWREASSLSHGSGSSSGGSSSSSRYPGHRGSPEARVRRCYGKLMRHWHMGKLWKSLPRIVDAMALDDGRQEPRPQSWKKVVESIMEVEGFGGTGFSAKEVVLDFLLTPLMGRVSDFDSWCPVGPGACRGLNRLAGRPLQCAPSGKTLLDELLSLFREAPNFYPQSLADERPLALHDVQFQLCEFDKYMRAKHGGGGKVRRFKPPIDCLCGG